ncbi:MAG: GNAT family N-acetyltransferase [Actinobacteria bacterium]|jgi:GNAT superfamily N-acetyltransferase|nr:GNAT family N-acetyltransferase [Actinomycetota bacterium]
MTDPSLLIRTATQADAEALADLGARTLRDTFGPEKTDAQADYLSLTFRPDVKSGALDDPDAIFLIAEAEGASIAYARLRFGYSPDSVGGAAPMEIARFYADAAWVGRGVGRALMESCFALAADRCCDVVWLDVWEKNDRAIAFYERWGFATVGSQAPGWSTMRRMIER